MDGTPDPGTAPDANPSVPVDATPVDTTPVDATSAQKEAPPPPTVENDAAPVEATPLERRRPRPSDTTGVADLLTAVSSENLDAAVDAALDGLTDADMAMASDSPEARDDFAVGDIVTGRVGNIGSEDILVDFGAKAMGTLALAELRRDDHFQIGDNVEVCISGRDKRSGLLRVSLKEARRRKLLGRIEVGLIVEGTVTGMNKGGLDLEVDGVRAFIPASQVDIHFMKDISDLIGQTVRAEVTQFDTESGDLVVSRRKALICETAEQKEKIFESLSVGDVRHGKVRSVTDYGAFIDLGGVDGLLHVSEMSWGRVSKPEDVVKVGDELEVKILKLHQEKKKISLGLKQIATNPWETAEQKYEVGKTQSGRVARLANFGAFIELEPGLDGLLPVSEMSWTRRLRHPSELVKEGDIVEVAIVNVDAAKQRITLSLKQLSEDPWAAAAAKYVVGSLVKGKVARTTDFGAFVALEDGIDGLVHISELDEGRVKAVTDKVQPGQAVEVRILGVDVETKRVSLSMRKPPPEPSPEEIAAGQATRAAEKKRRDKPRRGGITFGWDSEGFGGLDPSQFSK